MDFEKIIDFAVQNSSSDVHISPGLPIYYRINGQMKKAGKDKISPEQIQKMILPFLTNRQKKEIQERRQTDFLAKTSKNIRLRGNAFFQNNGLSVVFRIIPQEIPELLTLGFPEFVYEEILKTEKGLVLIVGSTGQGKSTTLASIIKKRADNLAENILTIEDPIEYIVPSNKSIVQQREVHRDVMNFSDGIRASLREDPDVVMVGELRDLETISAALTLAETGHLVFSTLHTNNGPETIHRIIDIFPSEQQDQVRAQLASSLLMVISQQLIPTIDGKGRTLAYEILTSNYAIKNHIRQNKIFQIPNVLQTDSSGTMVLMEQSLAGLVSMGKISKETAMQYSEDPDQLKSMLESQ
jgi:twitching motility protein PilT